MNTVHQKEFYKIVITGGPCAGKSTAMAWIQEAFTAKGYTVLFVPETATELITGGVAPWTCGTNVDYQKLQVRLQLEKERIFLEAAMTMPGNKFLIVCDRGIMDNRAYMNDEEFSQVLESVGSNEVELRDDYDAIFHLVSAAKGAEEFYTRANNAARTETPEQAAALDDKILAAWTGHPHLRVIDNATDFNVKMRRLIAEVTAFLGEPEPTEIERKFLIRFPDLQWLENYPTCRRVEIVQTYLTAPNGQEIRLRQRGVDDHYVYYRTVKRRLSDLKRVELEKRLRRSDYLSMLEEAGPDIRQIRKTRYCLTYQGQYFEVDLFPFWQDRALLEIELLSEDMPVELPEELQLIREVTDDPRYHNAALAQFAPMD